MCKWYCTSSGPSANLTCLHCGVHYCGACLNGEAGKMQSLVKCAGCGKKPGVKTNGNRNSWTAVCNAPCNERGAPRYDNDDGIANSAFTSGLRATGAQETNEAAQRRVRQHSLRGPERFFYDRSTYTGTHSNGGPEHVAKGAGSAPDRTWKRPSAELEDLARLTLLSGGAAAPRPASPSCLPDVVPMKSPRPPSVGRPSSKGPSARPASRGAGGGRGLVGPERFFYDRSTYTGTHTRGGPSSVAKGGGTSFDQSWKRPGAP